MQLGQLAGRDVPLPAGAAALEIAGLTADSREVVPGMLFAALSGTRTDGARYISQAVSNGASAILLRRGSSGAGAFGVPAIEVDNPRRTLARFAARFFARQPRVAVAVTGTNGKTSVASFVQQLWRGLGRASASLGTIGLATADGIRPHAGGLTSPEPVTLHRLLAGLADEGISHIAIEASSHGLQQYRCDGVDLTAAAFTNISRDHLDHHAGFEDYFAQKLRLFRDLVPDHGAIVVDAGAAGSDRVAEIARTRGVRLISVGCSAADVCLIERAREGFGQVLRLRHAGREYELRLPLVGDFQASNALVAAGLAIATGEAAEEVLPLIRELKGAVGRLEHCGTAACGAPVFVDYAHTPDAVRTALAALRPYASGRLVVVLGCGGDRDRGKRPQMGAEARENADLVYVTDDNPRREDPARIRSEILAAVPEAVEIGDRRQAIAAAISVLRHGDLLLVAGKGHETGQQFADRTLPFSDQEAIEDTLNLEAGDA